MQRTNSSPITVRQQQIVDKCINLIELLEEDYFIVLPTINILFNIKGTVAGQAARRAGEYIIRFNGAMIEGNGFEHIFNDTVPHELSHIVCYANPHIGKNHNRGWKKLCIALGGTGKCTHDEEILFARGKTYLYYSSTNREIRISSMTHNKIQNGKKYNCRGGGVLNSDCKYLVLN